MSSARGLVGGARGGEPGRQGAGVKAVHVRHMERDCLLEPETEGGEGFAVRMCLRFVKGFREPDAERIAAARRSGAFQSLKEFAERTRLEEGPLVLLAESGAKAKQVLDRHRPAMKKQDYLSFQRDQAEIVEFDGGA